MTVLSELTGIPVQNLPPQLQEIERYEWTDRKNMEDFKKNLKPLLLSAANGMEVQVQVYEEECKKILAADKTEGYLHINKGCGRP
jgi:hypothetical protein